MQVVYGVTTLITAKAFLLVASGFCDLMAGNDTKNHLQSIIVIHIAFSNHVMTRMEANLDIMDYAFILIFRTDMLSEAMVIEAF